MDWPCSVRAHYKILDNEPHNGDEYVTNMVHDSLESTSPRHDEN